MPEKQLRSGEKTWTNLDSVLSDVRTLHIADNPEQTPFKSKYSARGILKDIYSIYTERLVNEGESEEITSALGKIEYWYGLNYLESEELSFGDSFLRKSLKHLKSLNSLNFPLELIDSQNQLGMLCCQRAKYEESLHLLIDSQKLFIKLKKLSISLENNENPKTANNHNNEEKQQENHENIQNKENHHMNPNNVENEEKQLKLIKLPTNNEWEKLEELHTLTLFYLAQIYGRLNKRRLSANYCQLTMNKQLNTKDFNRFEWIQNAIGLSHYYTACGEFQQAHHCLSAAKYFVKPNEWPTKPNDSNKPETKEEQYAADVCRAFGHFYVHLLKKSRQQYIIDLRESENSSKEYAELVKKQHSDLQAEKLKNQEFDKQSKHKLQENSSKNNDLPVDIISHEKLNELPEPEADKVNKEENYRLDIEHTFQNEQSNHQTQQQQQQTRSSLFISFKSLNFPPSPSFELAKSYEEARNYFLEGKKWVDKALLYYPLDGFVSDNIPLLQDLSQLYRYVAAFEPDIPRKCKMQKRRIDLLHPLIKQIGQNVYLEFYQQITDECAGIYTELMELKRIQLKHTVIQKTTQKQLDQQQFKINELCLKAIHCYELWLTTFWQKQEIDPYYHKWILNAMFNIARLYGKIYHEEPNLLNQFLKKSFDQYNSCLCKSEEWKAQSYFHDEMDICREMIALLPLKMDKIVAHGGFQE